MDQPLPATRAEARFYETRRFATGRPCGRGHLAPRFTTNGNCIACERERQRSRPECIPEQLEFQQ